MSMTPTYTSYATNLLLNELIPPQKKIPFSTPKSTNQTSINLHYLQTIKIILMKSATVNHY